VVDAGTGPHGLVRFALRRNAQSSLGRDNCDNCIRRKGWWSVAI